MALYVIAAIGFTLAIAGEARAALRDMRALIKLRPRQKKRYSILSTRLIVGAALVYTWVVAWAANPNNSLQKYFHQISSDADSAEAELGLLLLLPSGIILPMVLFASFTNRYVGPRIFSKIVERHAKRQSRSPKKSESAHNRIPAVAIALIGYILILVTLNVHIWEDVRDEYILLSLEVFTLLNLFFLGRAEKSLLLRL